MRLAPETRIGACAALVLILGFARAQDTLPPPARREIDFARDIQPVFEKSCVKCHGPALQSNGLRLDRVGSALAGGYSGPVILPGRSAESKLIRLVAGLEPGRIMPLEGERLSADEIALLRAWIDQGAEWPEEGPPSKVASARAPKREHWAYRPPKQPAVPAVRNKAWVRNPIDAFILARLEGEGIAPSPEADRATLIRRLSFDLIGLPPTPEETAAFEADGPPDAYERLVDRLLASPHYGEKWARHWLDLARYADSDGYHIDRGRPYAWRYRDWVIEAFNRNMPFDQFTIEQIASDLLPSATVEQKIATGFHRNSLTNREGGVDREEFRVEAVIDRTSTVGAVWLGLTVGCARCHDHKYDPISQKEFYELAAFFNTVTDVDIEAPRRGELGLYLRGKPEYDRKRRELLEEYGVPKLQAEWEEEIRAAAAHPGVNVPYDVAWNALQRLGYGAETAVMRPASERSQKQQDVVTDHFLEWYGIVIPKERYNELKFAELRQKLAELREHYPPLTEAQTVAENPEAPRTHVLIRGDHRRPGIEVRPGTPAVLRALPPGPEPPRLRLARWLVSGESPLTARVAVNRSWQELFGTGLVATPQDFGARGEPPTHPELLDWLATEFVASRWNVKAFQRLIVTSATYRQSSAARQDVAARDPGNRLLARQSRLRLSSESIRDSALAVSGLLHPAIGGPSVRPPMPDGMVQLAITYNFGTRWKESQGVDRYRRGLYIFFQRTVPYPQLVNFDAPDSLLSCSRRERSTTPLQALDLLNDPVFFEAAQGLAARVLREGPGDLAGRIDYAIRLCLARQPTAPEAARLAEYYRRQKEILEKEPGSIEALFPAKGIERVDPAEAAVWVCIGSVLLNLDEFITRG